MNSQEREKLERAHERTLRALEATEEVLNDYRYQSVCQTEDLMTAVYHYCEDQSFPFPEDLGHQFQQNVEAYDRFIKKQQFEIEEAREEERHHFRKKLKE